MSAGDDHFLARWSRRKHEAKRAPAGESATAPPAVAPPPPLAEPPVAEQPADLEMPAEPPPLPPVESLTPQSDFTPFMKAEVDPGLRSQALKTLFQDPHFNVMDGLDVYIDDYSKPDPLPEGWLAKMNQVARLGAYLQPDEVQAAPAENPVSAESSPQEPAPRPPEAEALPGQEPTPRAAPTPPEIASDAVPPRGTPDHS